MEPLACTLLYTDDLVLVTLPVSSVQNNNCREVLVTLPIGSVQKINSHQYPRLISTSSTSTHPRHLDPLHQITDARGQEGWPTLLVLLLDRLCSVFSVFLFLHDCLSYVYTLLGQSRLRYLRYGVSSKSSPDISVPVSQFLRVSTALEYDKRIAFS